MSKHAIGEFLGLVQHAIAIETLKYYVESFDLHEDTFDEALRHFLASFRLPGEVRVANA